MTFEEWWETPKVCGDCFEDVAKAAWDAATAEVKKDHFRIGEEVQSRADDYNEWYNCVVVLSKHGIGYFYKDVRRIPEWEPKDGEAVLFNDLGISKAGIYNNGYIESGMMSFSGVEIKPWTHGKIGLPWDQV